VTRLLGRELAGVLFDKDGTLLDFHRTWDHAIGATLRELATDGRALEGAARAVGYDLAAGKVEDDSPIVAESNATIMGLLDGWLDTSEFESLLMAGAVASTRAATGATRLLETLVSGSVAVGVVTNDGEAVARQQLAHLGWAPHFAVVVGYDSGFGAKPAPGPVLAGLESMQVERTAAAMVGDSVHDVVAARDAGVLAVYLGSAPDICELADIVVSDLDEFASLLQ
jgi:phosphoglycolate phosphatase